MKTLKLLFITNLIFSSVAFADQLAPANIQINWDSSSAPLSRSDSGDEASNFLMSYGAGNRFALVSNCIFTNGVCRPLRHGEASALGCVISFSTTGGIIRMPNSGTLYRTSTAVAEVVPAVRAREPATKIAVSVDVPIGVVSGRSGGVMDSKVHFDCHFPIGNNAQETVAHLWDSVNQAFAGFVEVFPLSGGSVAAAPVAEQAPAPAAAPAESAPQSRAVSGPPRPVRRVRQAPGGIPIPAGLVRGGGGSSSGQ